MAQHWFFWIRSGWTIAKSGIRFCHSAIAFFGFSGFSGFLGSLLILCLALPLLVLPAQTASAASLASIHTYTENPGQTTFRSKQSLRDRSDRAWQVILFKRYQADDLQGLYLRLVGFPGLVFVDTQKPLKIATGASTQWQAPPALDPQTPSLPENAAQYDVATVMDALAGDIPLQVDIALADGSIAQLVVPPFAVHEWRDLNAQAPDEVLDAFAAD